MRQRAGKSGRERLRVQSNIRKVRHSTFCTRSVFDQECHASTSVAAAVKSPANWLGVLACFRARGA
jgi:hypothetical protein